MYIHMRFWVCICNICIIYLFINRYIYIHHRKIHLNYMDINAAPTLGAQNPWKHEGFRPSIYGSCMGHKPKNEGNVGSHGNKGSAVSRIAFPAQLGIRKTSWNSQIFCWEQPPSITEIRTITLSWYRLATLTSFEA